MGPKLNQFLALILKERDLKVVDCNNANLVLCYLKMYEPAVFDLYLDREVVQKFVQYRQGMNREQFQMRKVDLERKVSNSTNGLDKRRNR